MKKRLLQTLITGLVVSSFIITPVMATPQEEAERLEQSVEKLEGNVEKLEGNVEKLEQEKAQKEAQAQNVNAELSGLLLEYNALQLDMENQEKKIEKAAKDLSKAEKKEKKQYEDMKLRIKYMYEQGDASVIETLVQAKDFTDLVNKAEYVQEVHTYDREQLAKYVETKNAVKELKLDLEAGHLEMQDMSKEMEHQKKNLEATLTRMRSEIDNFDEQLEEAKAQAQAELERLRAETERAEAARAAAEEAERLEAERLEAERLEAERLEAERLEAERLEAERLEAEAEEDDQDEESQDEESQDEEADEEDEEEEESTSSTPSNASLGQQIADMGCRYVGNRYVWGGNSLTNGVDCSGFVQQIHAKFGISTPRSSSSQRYSGKYVSYSEMLPGDVVCYSGHVAIYIGNNQIVHASNSAPYPRGGIKISSPPNYRTVLAVRRYW